MTQKDYTIQKDSCYLSNHVYIRVIQPSGFAPLDGLRFKWCSPLFYGEVLPW